MSNSAVAATAATTKEDRNNRGNSTGKDNSCSGDSNNNQTVEIYDLTTSST